VQGNSFRSLLQHYCSVIGLAAVIPTVYYSLTLRRYCITVGKDLPEWRLVDKVLSITEAGLHFLSKKVKKSVKKWLSNSLRRTLLKQMEI
jgi:hypothetical protein